MLANCCKEYFCANHRLYYTATKDFKTFGKTKLLYGPGFNVIDATIQKSGNQYVMFFKDETRTPPQKNIRLAFSNHLTNGYGKPSAPITGNYWAEGPTAIIIGNDMPAGKVKSNGPIVIKDKTPHFTNFYFDSIYCNGAKTAVSITGLPEMPVDKIYFKNMVISADKGFEATDAADLNLDNVKVISSGEPLFQLNSVKNISIKGSGLKGSTKSYYKADANTSGVNIIN